MPRHQPASAALLFGPYHAPKLHAGDRAQCLLRDAKVVVTSWTSAPIPWPRCRAEGTRGGGSGLLLAGDLVEAVRRESAAALMHHWGVTAGVVWRWRKALGVGRADTEGSRRLIQAAADRGADVQRGQPLGGGQVERRRQTAVALNLGHNLPHTPTWTAGQLALLGTLPDAFVAAQIGRTVAAVCIRRNRLGIPTAEDGRRCR